MKTERTQVHFLSDVFAAVASQDLKVAIISPTHSSMSESQNFPVKPEVQLHVNESIPSMHVPLLQLCDGQSSILCSQCVPLNPSTQEQLQPSIPSTHVPLFLQGFESHSLISKSQNSPWNPAGHWQVKLLTPSMHVAFATQESLLQSFIFTVEQLKSVKPGTQLQLYVPFKFKQVALFLQTCSSHSFMSVSQFLPVQPDAHLQVQLKIPSVQVEPFLQGELAQSSVFISQL